MDAGAPQLGGKESVQGLKDGGGWLLLRDGEGFGLAGGVGGAVGAGVGGDEAGGGGWEDADALACGGEDFGVVL